MLGKLSALGTERVAQRVHPGRHRQGRRRRRAACRARATAIVRLRTLYAGASKVADVITIESELATRESDLESLEAQQRALAAQTSMATVHARR